MEERKITPLGEAISGLERAEESLQEQIFREKVKPELDKMVMLAKTNPVYQKVKGVFDEATNRLGRIKTLNPLTLEGPIGDPNFSGKQSESSTFYSGDTQLRFPGDFINEKGIMAENLRLEFSFDYHTSYVNDGDTQSETDLVITYAPEKQLVGFGTDDKSAKPSIFIGDERGFNNFVLTFARWFTGKRYSSVKSILPTIIHGGGGHKYEDGEMDGPDTGGGR